MGATGAGGGDWEKKKGGREKGRPCEGTKPLQEEHFRRHTAKQNNQTEGSACAPECQTAGHLCVGQGHVSAGGAERREGDSHLLPELLRVAVFPCPAGPSPSVSQIQTAATHSLGGSICKEQVGVGLQGVARPASGPNCHLGPQSNLAQASVSSP